MSKSSKIDFVVMLPNGDVKELNNKKEFAEKHNINYIDLIHYTTKNKIKELTRENTDNSKYIFIPKKQYTKMSKRELDSYRFNYIIFTELGEKIKFNNLRHFIKENLTISVTNRTPVDNLKDKLFISSYKYNFHLFNYSKYLELPQECKKLLGSKNKFPPKKENYNNKMVIAISPTGVKYITENKMKASKILKTSRSVVYRHNDFDYYKMIKGWHLLKLEYYKQLNNYAKGVLKNKGTILKITEDKIKEG